MLSYPRAKVSSTPAIRSIADASAYWITHTSRVMTAVVGGVRKAPLNYRSAGANALSITSPIGCQALPSEHQSHLPDRVEIKRTGVDHNARQHDAAR
jgi:hypothetical protein